MNDDRPLDEPAMIRSEERLHVTTRLTSTGRAILRRTVVVEQRTITVEVRHEEVSLEIVPFDVPQPVGAEGARALHLAPPELVLHREEVVVTKRIVPVERVRLQITPVTEHQQVVEDVRAERIEFDDGTATAPVPDPSGR